MDIVVYFLISLVVIVLGGLILAWIQKGGLKKILGKSKSKPKIDTKEIEDRRLLQECDQPLRNINQLPSFPDTPIKEIQAALYKIRDNATQIDTEKLQDIKEELIRYSEKLDKLHINMDYKQLRDLLEINELTPYNLLQEIRNILSNKNGWHA